MSRPVVPGSNPGIFRDSRVFFHLLLRGVAICILLFGTGFAFAQTSPAFQWSATAGGVDNEAVAGVATDAAGNVYVTGYFSNSVTFGAIPLTSAGGTDIFVAKYSTNGALIWVRQFGGTGNEVVRGITANAAGDMFIVGSFEGTASFGSTTLISAGGADAFVARVQSSAGIVSWAASAGGPGDDRATGIFGGFTLGVIGEFSGTATFQGAVPGRTTTLTSAGGQDVFGWALGDALGNFYNAISVGGTGDETAATASSSSGVFQFPLAGSFSGTMTAGANGPVARVLTSAGGTDGFLATWDPVVNRISTAVAIGGAGDDAVQVVNTTGIAVVLAGKFGATVTCPPGVGSPPIFPPISLTNSSASGSDVFWAAYNDLGSLLYPVYASAFGGPGDENATGLAVDSTRQIYLTGTFTGSTRVGGSLLSSAGLQDAFVTKLSSVGVPIWARALGGTGNDAAPAVTVYYPGGSAPVLVAGTYETSLSLGGVLLNSAGAADIFVTGFEADPRIVSQPLPVSVALGGTASFTVVAAGTGPLTYQWFQTTQVGSNPPVTLTLTNQTSPSLVLNNVTTNAAGNYSVRVTGAFGSIASTAVRLTFLNNLAITTQPLSRTVTRGSTAVFSVVLSASGPVAYQWRHNGVDLLNANAAALIVPAAQLADAGLYDVVVSDGVTTLTSVSAALFINSPPIITSQPLGLTAPPGTNVTFSVGFDGTAPLSFQWRRNGVAIPGANGPTLSLTNIQAGPHAGGYSLIISNVFASVLSDTATLVVGIPPVISLQPFSQAAPVGTNLLLSVTASSIAPLAYQWFYAGTPILFATNATLMLTNAQTPHTGNYYAQVTDGTITVNTSNFFVRVFSPFTLTSPRCTNNRSFSFSFTGDNGQYYRLEASTDLTTWQPMATNIAIAGVAAFSDTSITNQPGRFYRVTLLP